MTFLIVAFAALLAPALWLLASAVWWYGWERRRLDREARDYIEGDESCG